MDLFNNLEKQLKKIVGGDDRALKKYSRKSESALKKTSRKNEKTLKDISKANEKLLKKYLTGRILADIRKEGRIPVTAKRRNEVYVKYNGTCHNSSCRKKSTLDIHHINFKNSDNRLSNLRLLCKNHHGDIHERKFKKPYSKEWHKKKGKKK